MIAYWELFSIALGWIVQSVWRSPLLKINVHSVLITPCFEKWLSMFGYRLSHTYLVPCFLRATRPVRQQLCLSIYPHPQRSVWLRPNSSIHLSLFLLFCCSSSGVSGYHWFSSTVIPLLHYNSATITFFFLMYMSDLVSLPCSDFIAYLI